GGGVVNVASDNPAVQVPATVTVPAGNSAVSFPITTSAVTLATTARIDVAAGGVLRSQFVNVSPDPNAPPLLLSITLSVAGVTGGNGRPGTVSPSAKAPAGGLTVTLSTSNLVAQPPPIVLVPAGLGFASFTIPTSPVTVSTPVTITGVLGTTTRTADLTVLPS